MSALRIGIAGLGTVGSALVRLLERRKTALAARTGKKIDIVAVTARDPRKKRNLPLKAEWVADALDMARMDEIDVVVELIGGADGIAHELCVAALDAGKSVVTANKAMLAVHGAELAALAEEKGASLLFEAAVGGGIPVIKTMREALTGNEILRVQGIMNGTCNYILTRMDNDAMSFADALREAQRLGYAEADPSADVDGHDTAHKLAVLSSLAFGIKPDLSGIAQTGLRDITPQDLVSAAKLGYRIKLVGVALKTENGIERRVGPCLVPEDVPLAKIDGVLNAIAISGDAVGSLTLAGPGAGGAATASAVAGDLADLACGVKRKVWGRPCAALEKADDISKEKRVGKWYVRLQVTDKAGVLARIAAAFGAKDVSIESFIQQGRSQDDSVPLIIVTHETNEAAFRRALDTISGLKEVWEKPVALRIETREQ